MNNKGLPAIQFLFCRYPARLTLFTALPPTNMQQFTISDMERLSGIKSHTLRVWEQRYGIITPARKESQHRLYSNEDLKDLLRVVHLYYQGHRISTIARMGKQVIDEKIKADIEAGQFYKAVTDRLLQYSMDFDDDSFSRTLQAIKLELGMEETMDKVVYPFLQKVGLMWMTDSLIPCQEHFASNLIRQMLVAEINSLPRTSASAYRIVLFTPPEEYHEIPILYMQYLMKLNGLGVINLGVNVPLEGLEIIVNKRPIEILHFHLITNLSNLSTQEYLERLCQRFPDKTIVISGIETQNIDSADMPENARIIHSSIEFHAYLKDRMVAEGIIKSLN